MSKENPFKKTKRFVRTSATLKVLSIVLLVLLLLMPTSMIKSLVKERESRREDVVEEINQKWGDSQTIAGPFFTVPYKSYYKDDKDQQKFVFKYLHVLPETLNITGVLNPEIRYRSLYEAVLYTADLNFSGNFLLPSPGQLNIESPDILWDKAVFSIGITDMRGIRRNIEIKFDDAVFKAEPGLKTADIAPAGVGVTMDISGLRESSAFSFSLSLNGSQRIEFVPLAETTTVELRSSWPSPSFDGAFLPAERRIDKNGFSAAWKVLHLNRNYPQYWPGSQYKVVSSAFGLKLRVTADIYQKTMRISKYAVMFIILTFAAFFFTEMITSRRVHPIQYLLVGLAILLFYTLLLSLSEYINFDYAYILSALAVTSVITGYAQGILKTRRFTFIVFGILVLLYAYLYIVLQLEDYALLMGSLGLLLILSAIMLITRNIDWYAIGPEKNIEEPEDIP